MKAPAMSLRSRKSRLDYARLIFCKYQQCLMEGPQRPQLHKLRHKSYLRMDTLLERGSVYTDFKK